MRGDTASAEERLAELQRRCGEIDERLAEIDRRLKALTGEREGLNRERARLQSRVEAEVERAAEAEASVEELTGETQKRPASPEAIVDRLYRKYESVLGPVASRPGGALGTGDQRQLISDLADQLNERREREIAAEDAVQACIERVDRTDDQAEWTRASRELGKALKALERVRRENEKAWVDLDTPVEGGR